MNSDDIDSDQYDLPSSKQLNGGRNLNNTDLAANASRTDLDISAMSSQNLAKQVIKKD